MNDALSAEEESQRLASLLNLNILDTPIDNRFERVTRLVQSFLKVPIASFNLVDQDRQWSKSTQGLSVVEIARKESFCSHVIQGERVMVVPDARTDTRFEGNPLVTGNPNIVFYAGCPVHAPDGERIGALCAIDKKPRELTPKEAQTLRDLAGVLESELRLEQLTHKIEGLEEKLTTAEKLALIDPLTRLWNRAGVINVLKRVWNEGMRNREPVACVIADIDLFKSINDTYGHAVGDSVLQQVSKILMSTLRGEDAIGRIGGEEFLIVLPGCPQDKVYEIVERIRRETLLSDITHEGQILPVTLSFGAVGTVPADSIEMTDLMKLADDALYQAKKSGRNKTVVLTDETLNAAA